MVTDDQTVLEIHMATRRAFLERSAGLVAPYIGARGLTVVDGSVREESFAQWHERFSALLAAATFDRWDDVEAPRMGTSADGTMAWLVEVVESAGIHGATPFTTRTARLTVFERRDGGWRRTVHASTDLRV